MSCVYEPLKPTGFSRGLLTFKDHVEEAEAALEALDGYSSPDKEKALASLRKAVQFFSSCVPYIGSLISGVAFFESLQEKEETGIGTDGDC